ncbi:MAG: S8 family serine peptidase [Bacteroidales bacterium]|nr:S8 family serine peptidase [Bacteroidales bacterium]
MRKIFYTLAFLFLSNIAFSQNTIDPILQEVLYQKDNELVSVNIILKAQIDHDALQEKAKRVTDKKSRRDMLVDEFKLFTEKEQNEVMSILIAEERNGCVSDINSHWLSNAISCKASREVIHLLSKHNDIELIGHDKMQYMCYEHTTEDVVVEDNREMELTDNIIMVNADKVWDMGYTGKGVLVAILDSGVNYNHLDLADHLWDGGSQYPNHGYNIINNTNDPMDHFGHGTHCAGTICGDGTSGLRTGMAPDATLMCVKVLDDYGYGSTSAFNSGMEFAIEHQADIISMSLGVMNASVTDKTLLRNTCVNALQLGVIASVAVGNDGQMTMVPVPNNVRTPGNCPPPWIHPDQEVNAGGLSCVVAVGAIDFNENMYENGSKGPVTWTDTEFNDYPYNPNIGLIRPDICAPGVGIKSLDHDNNDGYNLKTGTSMATPCVAGILALMLEKENNLSPAELCMTIETTAKKLTENKSNLTGSGLIDAYNAIINIKKGDFNYSEITINDKEGNDNGNINADEDIKLSANIINNGETEYNNIKAILSSKNNNVEIIDNEAFISNIDANGEFKIVDEFSFHVNENTACKSELTFDIDFYNSSNEKISSFSFMLYVSGYKLEFASFVVENDDNDNGLLEAGETADLGIIINNTGNEIALEVNGLLSSESESITINNSESSFSSLGSMSSSVAYFNVTLSENVGETFEIPFTLTTTDYYEKTSEFTLSYANACDIIFELNDAYGDGWNGASLIVKFDDGTEDKTLTIQNGNYETYTFNVKANVEVSLEWEKGEYDSECSFVVKKTNGNIIYSSPSFQNKGEFLFSWVNECSCANMSFNMCDAVQNLQGEQKQDVIELSWNAAGDATSYDIYRGSRFLGNTSETTFTDDYELIDGTTYLYNVQVVYSDETCVGKLSTTEVTFSTESVSENGIINVSVFPNPNNGEFIVKCDNMNRITVYNVIGSIVKDIEVNTDSFVIEGLNSGVYFVNIRNNDSNIIKKVVVRN